MTPRERNNFIEWTALGLLAHDVYAFQVPKGISFGFLLRDALRESGAPYRFDLSKDPDKIIEHSTSHPLYNILGARWRSCVDNNGRYCLIPFFVAAVDQEAFESGESGLRLVAEICHEGPENVKKTSLYHFGALMIDKLNQQRCAVHTNREA